MNVVCLLVQDYYKPGDPRPDGYLAFHEWARVQLRGGLKQTRCRLCGLWRFPQEYSKRPVCRKCAG